MRLGGVRHSLVGNGGRGECGRQPPHGFEQILHNKWQVGENPDADKKK